LTAALAFVSIGEERNWRRSMLGQAHGPLTKLWNRSSTTNCRFQVADVNGSAWLLIIENDQWWTEARYD
jgi:protein ImuB